VALPWSGYGLAPSSAGSACRLWACPAMGWPSHDQAMPWGGPAMGSLNNGLVRLCAAPHGDGLAPQWAAPAVGWLGHGMPMVRSRHGPGCNCAGLLYVGFTMRWAIQGLDSTGHGLASTWARLDTGWAGHSLRWPWAGLAMGCAYHGLGLPGNVLGWQSGGLAMGLAGHGLG
jgi:hypothetical protein